MRYVPPAYDVEVIKDTSVEMERSRAKRRMGSITASAEEQLLYKCDPNGARGNDNPGIPDESIAVY